MTIQNTVQMGRVIQNAIVFNFQKWMGGAMHTDSLPQAVEELFDLLERRRIETVLVGGIALLTYIEGRNTQDIDLIMALSSLKKLPELKIASQDPNFARAAFGELQVDVLLTRNPLFKKVQHSYAAARRFGERDIRIASVEGLILLKLYALPSLYRQGNFAKVGLYENDIATLMQAYRPDLAPLVVELVKVLDASDVGEVQTILADIQKRIERFKSV